MGLSKIQEEFSVEDHYESKIRQGSISDHGAVLRFIRKPFTPKIHEKNKGFRRIIKDRFKYEDFLEITQLHNEYLRELKGNLGPKSFMDLIYKAELTGAKIVISDKEGIVVEERRNSLSVIFPNNIIKIYPKNTWNFKLHFEDIDYLFFSKSLKINRFNKK